MTLKANFTHHFARLGIALLIALVAMSGDKAFAQSTTEANGVGLNAAATDKEVSKKGASENKAEGKSEAKTNLASSAEFVFASDLPSALFSEAPFLLTSLSVAAVQEE